MSKYKNKIENKNKTNTLSALIHSGPDGQLIDFHDRNNLGGGGNGGAPQPLGFIDFPQPPTLPVMPPLPHHAPFNYPPPPPGGPGGSNNGGACAGAGFCPPTAPFNYNIPPYPQIDPEKKDLNINNQFLSVSALLNSI